jgi:hypothetical protein
MSMGLLKSTKPQCEPSETQLSACVRRTALRYLFLVSKTKLTRRLIPDQSLHLRIHPQHHLSGYRNQHILLLPQIPLREEIREHDPPRQRIPRILDPIRPTRMSCRRQENQRRPGLHLSIHRLVIPRQPLIVPLMRPRDHERRAVLFDGLRARDQDPDLSDIFLAEGPVVPRAPDVLVAVQRLLASAGPHVEADAQREPRGDVRVSGLHVVGAGVVGPRNVHVEEFVPEAFEERVEADAFADGVASGGEAPEEFGFLREECAWGLVVEVVVSAGEFGLDCG